jgi:hypothetical protein
MMVPIGFLTTSIFLVEAGEAAAVEVSPLSVDLGFWNP